MAKYLYLDIESHNAGKQYSMRPQEFVRLFQYAWDDGPVACITDYPQMLDLIRQADYVVGHNALAFDLPVLFGEDSLEPLQMALRYKVIDTYVLASLVYPAPYSYTDRKGHTYYDAAKPESAKKWLSLDNLCFQLGLEGKLGDLKEMAKRYNPPKTPVGQLDFSLIPLDDPEFLDYAVQDIIAVRALWKRLREMLKAQNYRGDYIWREMLIWSINAQISRNGVLVDQQAARDRVTELAAKRDTVMQMLVNDYGFPTEGKSPWASAKGKEVIMAILAEHGITPDSRPDWPRTPTGAPKLGGDELVSLTEGTPAEEFGSAMAMLKGQRSLAQLALDSTKEDGRVHPDIACLQRSGRTSVQNPGLTVWTKNEEKRYFIADPGCVMVEMDYSAADARAVAAVSGDPEFAKRFEPGIDAHDLTGVIFFGEDTYYAARDNLRPLAKKGGHAMAYRVGSKKLAAGLGVTLEEATGFIDAYKRAYPLVARWQDEVTAEGEHGYVTNWWGRRMRVDPERSFTQSSALIGQSTTREVLFDGLIRIARDNIEVLRWLRMTVHDAVVWSIPKDKVGAAVPWIVERMSLTFDPQTQVSQPIDFTMSVGPLDATDWYAAGH